MHVPPTKQRTERVRERRKQVSHARESVRFVRCKRVRVNGARYATRTRRVRLAQPADYSNTTEERPRWDGSLNATMLPPVWVERAGSESACLGRARPLSDLVDMPIDTVYMSMDMPCRGTAKAMLSLSLSFCLLFPSLVYARLCNSSFLIFPLPLIFPLSFLSSPSFLPLPPSSLRSFLVQEARRPSRSHKRR